MQHHELPAWCHLIYACGYNVIFVTESWLYNDIPTSLLDPDDCFDVTGKITEVEGYAALYQKITIPDHFSSLIVLF